MALEKVQVLIESLLDSSGFRQASDRLDALQKKFNSMNSLFSKARGINRQTEGIQNMQEKLDEAGIQMNKIGDGSFTFRNQEGKFISQAQAAEQLADSLGTTKMESAGLSQEVSKTMNPALSEAQQMSTGQVRQLSMMDSVMNTVRGRVAGIVQGFKNQRRASMKSASQTQGFRFEMLSLMFAAMSVKRVLSGLLRPSLKAVGAFEIFGNVLKIFFLPAAFFVLDIIQKISNIMLALPKPVRKAINAAVLFGSVLATLTLAATMAALAIDGWKLAVAKGGAASTLHAAGVSVLSAAYSALTGAVGIATSAVGVFTGIISGLVGIITSPAVIIGAIVGGLALLANWAIEAATGVDILGRAFDFVAGLAGDLWDWIKDLVPAIEDVSGALSNFIDGAKKALGLTSGDGANNAGPGQTTDPSNTTGLFSQGAPEAPTNVPAGRGGLPGSNIGQQINNIEISGTQQPTEVANEVDRELGRRSRRRI